MSTDPGTKSGARKTEYKDGSSALILGFLKLALSPN